MLKNNPSLETGARRGVTKVTTVCFEGLAEAQTRCGVRTDSNWTLLGEQVAQTLRPQRRQW
eukprot:6412953-Amphidinium_carterae.1